MVKYIRKALQIYSTRRCLGEDDVAVIDMRLSYRGRGCPRGALTRRDSRPDWLAFTAQLVAGSSRRARRAVNRLEVDEDGISRLRHYFFTPDFVAEVAGEV